MSNKIKKGSKVISNNPFIGKDPVEVYDLLIDNIFVFVSGDESYFTHVALSKNGITYIEKKENVFLVQEHNDYISEFISLELGFDSIDAHAGMKSVCEECKGKGVLDFDFYTRKCMKCSGD